MEFRGNDASVPTSSNTSLLLAIRKKASLPKPKFHMKWKLYRVLQGHMGWVRCVDVDPSNEWFVTGSTDRMIKIWDLATGGLKLTLTGHTHNIRSVKVHPVLKYLFSAGEDNMVKCWDLEQNKVIRHYHGHLSGVYCLKPHPIDYNLLFTGSRDATTRVWDIRTKECVHILSGHNHTVQCIETTASSGNQSFDWLMTGSMDCTVRIYDIPSGFKKLETLTHHKKAIRSISCNLATKNESNAQNDSHSSYDTDIDYDCYFNTCAADHIKVWKCAPNEQSSPAKFSRNIDGYNNDVLNCSAIRTDNIDGSIMVAGSDNGHLHFWDYDSGKLFQTIESPPQPGSLSSENGIFDLCFDKSYTRIITAECDKTIKMYREVSET